MRKHLKDGSEVAHYWANQVQSEGQASNFSFNEGRIYSYSTIMAELVTTKDGRELYLLNNGGYSITTSKHQSLIRSAIGYDSGRETLAVPWYVPRGESSLMLHPVIFAQKVTDVHISAAQHVTDAKKPRIRDNTRAKHYASAEHLITGLENYAAAFGYEYTRPALELIAAEIEKARELEEAARVAYLKKREEEEAADLALWIDGKPRLGALGQALPERYFNKCALRIAGDMIETSQGAAVPVEHARALWPMLSRWRSEGKTYNGAINNRSLKLGVYSVNSFDGQVLQVGCHAIPWAELERMAGLLGLESRELVAA